MASFDSMPSMLCVALGVGDAAVMPLAPALGGLAGLHLKCAWAPHGDITSAPEGTGVPGWPCLVMVVLELSDSTERWAVSLPSVHSVSSHSVLCLNSTRGFLWFRWDWLLPRETSAPLAVGTLCLAQPCVGRGGVAGFGWSRCRSCPSGSHPMKQSEMARSTAWLRESQGTGAGFTIACAGKLSTCGPSRAASSVVA